MQPNIQMTRAMVQIHDCHISMCIGVPDIEIIYSIYKNLPHEVKLLAKQWGWNDTEVRDKICQFIIQ